MVMNGTLAEGVLPGLLRHVYVGRRTGLLHFTRGGERRSVRVQRGHVVHADTNVREERLGETIVRRGLLGEEELRRATDVMMRRGIRLGQALLEMGIMTRDRLEDALAAHVRDILVKVFTWSEGTYAFEELEAEAPLDGEATLKVSTGELILEAVRSIQDPEAIRRALGNLDRILAPSTDAFFRYQRIALTPADGYVLSRVDGTISAREVLQLIPLAAEETERTLFGLLCVGLLEYLPAVPRGATRVADTQPTHRDTQAAVAQVPSAALARETAGMVGKYRVLGLIGKGAMGMVYQARDTVLDRDVALKVMVAHVADHPEMKARFEREAKAVARMTHPNIVTVFDLGTHADGSPFIAMELLKGQDLRETMRSALPLSHQEKISIVIQVLAGLGHAHREGIVHRDIKPANVFINLEGIVKIMDFGVARLQSASMTRTGRVVGTADYMSPEQAQGERVDGRSDLFSVGCMLFELLGGRQPFHAESMVATLYKIIHEEPSFDAIPRTAENLALLPILRRSLARNMDERYQTAAEFTTALRDYLKGQGLSASA
jgi:tRNA A-37 threonylcarbamoyl transferase component Bud32